MEPWVEIQPLISSLVAKLHNNYGYLRQVTVSRKRRVVMKQSIGAYASVVIAGLAITDKTLPACGSMALSYVNTAMHSGQETVKVQEPF
jgi:hypothetical protein